MRGKSACNVEAPAEAPPIRSYHRLRREQIPQWRATGDERGPEDVAHAPFVRRLQHHRPGQNNGSTGFRQRLNVVC